MAIKFAILSEPVVALLPVAEPRGILRRSSSISDLAEAIGERIFTSARFAEQSAQSLIAKAFRGVLVNSSDSSQV